MTTCPACGRPVPASPDRCYYCGAALGGAANASAPATAAPPRNAATAAAGPARAPSPEASRAASPEASRAPRGAHAAEAEMLAAFHVARAASGAQPLAPPPGTQVVAAHPSAETGEFLVTVRGHAVNLPRCCACCLGSADETFRVSAVHATRQVMGVDRGTVTTKSFEFPTCGECARHMQAESLGALGAFVVAGLAYAGVIYRLGLDFFLDPARHHEMRVGSLILAVVLLVGALAAAVGLKKIFDRLRHDPGEGHADRGRPVEARFASFTASEHDWKRAESSVTFSFKNRRFGEQFARLNGPTA